MKKMLTLLAVAAMPATLSGCAACCPTAALCPCCPCNWFNQPAACPPAPVYAAPVAAAPCPPAMAPTVVPQYVPPMAAPLAASAAAPYSPCATWNPCQGIVAQPAMAPPMFAQPQAAPCCPPQMYAQAQPMMHQAPPMAPAYYGEPGCGYVESSCGAPYFGAVSYGPEMVVDCDPCSSGCCEPGGMVNPGPTPERFVDPRPMAE